MQHTVNGWTGSQWIDVQYFRMWLKNEIGLQVYLARLNAEILPQNDAEGSALIFDTVEGVLKQALAAGFISPGTVSERVRADIAGITGAPDFNGRLGRGYLIYIPAFATLSDANRNARRMPTVYFWLRGSGAINEITIEGTYSA